MKTATKDRLIFFAALGLGLLFASLSFQLGLKHPEIISAAIDWFKSFF